MPYYRPRDIGCNRIHVYHDDGSYSHHKVKDGFYFEAFEDIFKHPMYENHKKNFTVKGSRLFAGKIVIGFILESEHQLPCDVR